MDIKNKNKINLIILTATLIVFLFTTVVLSKPIKLSNFNNIIKSKLLNNVNKWVWRCKPNGGVLLQTSASALSYLGITITSIFYEDLRNDMNSINWNIFNENQSAVLSSKKVSFYKGVPVFRIGGTRAGSFLAIFLTDYERNDSIYNKNVINHELGHSIQQMIMGPINYLLCIGLPSWQEWSNRDYYDRPWEITADIFGGVNSRTHNSSDIERGYRYLYTSSIFGTLAYSFILGEY